MKPITDDIVKKNVDFIVEGITDTIRTYGKRDPGSEGENAAQAHFAEWMKDYTDEVKVEHFKLNPDSFFGWIIFCVVLLPIAILCLWFQLALVSLVLCLACVALIILQLLFYKQVTAPFFKEKTSTNVYGVKKPTGEIKRRIIFCGHSDATFEWGWLHLGGPALLYTSVGLAVVALVFTLAMSVAGLALNGLFAAIVAPGAYRTALIVLTAYGVPAVLTLLYYSDRRVITDGANDNLTACFEAMAVLKTMKEEGIEFEHTEVCVLTAGSEEAGLRGSMAFAKAHKEELSDVETVVIVMETLREEEFISIFARDLNGLVKADPQACKLVKLSGEKALGRPIPYGMVEVGATDSASFNKAGIKATCLGALNHSLRDYYHTRRDTYDNMSPECLDKIYRIIMQTLEDFDSDGLPEA